MKHITLEYTGVNWAEFDIDDKYTLQQIQKFIDLKKGEYTVSKTNDEVVSDLRKHGVKIHNYDAFSDSDSVNKIHIFTEDGMDLLE